MLVTNCSELYQYSHDRYKIYKTLTVQYNNRVDVRGRKYVFGPTQAHFSPSRRRGLKWVLRRAKNIFTPKNINSITIIIISEGIQKRNQRQYSKRYLERCQRRVDVYFTVISLYKSIHCRIYSFKLRQNTPEFVERIFASKFSKGK